MATLPSPRPLSTLYRPKLTWRGGAWSGGPGVGARCGNGLFSTYKLASESPNFILAGGGKPDFAQKLIGPYVQAFWYEGTWGHPKDTPTPLYSAGGVTFAVGRGR